MLLINKELIIKVKNVFICILTAIFLCTMGLWLLLKDPDSFSFSERRALKQNPSFENVSEFEDYVLDQFPLRGSFRKLKAIADIYMFNKKDSNGYYKYQESISKMEYSVNNDIINNNCNCMKYIYNNYLKPVGIKPNLVLIPDKNYFLAKPAGMLSMDYVKLYNTIKSQTEFMNYIEIRDMLNINSYYLTDTHWRQETLTEVAERIGMFMGSQVSDSYEQYIAVNPFYGVYYGQSAFDARPDVLRYLNNDRLDSCRVTCYITDKPIIKDIYDFNKALKVDPYDLYLSGASSVSIIENTLSESDKELIIFRDSFGSSLAPLFISGYRKVTLIDLRYISVEYVKQYIDFKNQDVLFLYSTQIINSVKFGDKNL